MTQFLSRGLIVTRINLSDSTGRKARMLACAKRFDRGKVRADQVARSRGLPED